MRTFVTLIVLLTVCLGGALAADKTPLAAVLKAGHDAIAKAPEAKASIASAKLPTPSHKTYNGLQATSVSTSYQISGLPTFFAAGTGFDYDVALPLSLMRGGDAAAVSVTFNSDTYYSYCAAAYAIVPMGGGEAIAAGRSPAVSCITSSIYAVSFPFTMPAAPGDYAVLGVVLGTTSGDTLVSFLHIID